MAMTAPKYDLIPTHRHTHAWVFHELSQRKLANEFKTQLQIQSSWYTFYTLKFKYCMYFLFIWYFGFVSSDNFCISTQTVSTLFASPCPANAVKFQVVKNGLQNWTGGTVWCGRFKHKLLSTLWKTSTPFDMQLPVAWWQSNCKIKTLLACSRKTQHNLKHTTKFKEQQQNGKWKLFPESTVLSLCRSVLSE